MNILVVSNYLLYQEKSSSFVHQQAAAYARLGHRVRVLILTAFGKPDFFGDRGVRRFYRKNCDGIELVPVRYLSLSKLGEKKFNAKSAASAAVSAARRLADDFQPDVIHAHALTTSAAVGAALKQLYNCPLVITTHGSDTSVAMEQGKGAQLKDLCKQADTIIAVSSALADMLRQCGTGTPIKVILNGFALGHLPNTFEKKPFTIIQVGRLNHQKRVRVTICAFAQIVQKYPAARLTLVGKGTDEEALMQLCHELGISDAVTFTGQLPNDQVLQEMAKSQFFVMPSVREGFGIVYLEAMACGCITIGTQGEGISDLVINGENGFLVPPDDAESIVRAVEGCLANLSAADELAKKGQIAARELTWERNAACCVELFRELSAV